MLCKWVSPKHSKNLHKLHFASLIRGHRDYIYYSGTIQRCSAEAKVLLALLAFIAPVRCLNQALGTLRSFQESTALVQHGQSHQNLLPRPTLGHATLRNTTWQRNSRSYSASQGTYCISTKSLDAGGVSPDDEAAKATSGSSPQDLAPGVHQTTATNFSITLSQKKCNKFGLWAQFLQVFGLGGEFSVEFSSDRVDTCTFETMVTEWLTPPTRLVNEAVKAEQVQGFLKMAPPKTPLYIITGLKTVSGVTASTSRANASGYTAQLGADGTAAGVPVTVGPKTGHTGARGEQVSWKCQGPLVFAYQLAQISFKKGAWVMKDYQKGAMFGMDQEVGGTEIEVDESEAERDFVNELEDVEVREGWDEGNGEECVVVVPKRV